MKFEDLIQTDLETDPTLPAQEEISEDEILGVTGGMRGTGPNSCGERGYDDL